MDYPQKPPSVMWRFYSDMVYMNTNLHPDGEGKSNSTPGNIVVAILQVSRLRIYFPNFNC